jgi:hypothetical protein
VENLNYSVNQVSPKQTKVSSLIHVNQKQYGDTIPFQRLVEFLSEYEIKGTPESISFDSQAILLRYKVENIDYSFNEFEFPVVISSIKKGDVFISIRFSALKDEMKTKLVNQIVALKTVIHLFGLY